MLLSPCITVAVIGFERSAYIVYEGHSTEVCVALLDRKLSNNEIRQFSVATEQLINHAANGSMYIDHYSIVNKLSTL